MLTLPRPFRALFAASVLSLSLTLAPLSAQAELHQNLAPLPDDTAFAMTVKLDPGSWSYLTSKLMQTMSMTSTSTTASEANDTPAENTEAEAQTEESDVTFDLGDISKTLKDELGIDPVWDVLANLGTHLSVALRPCRSRGRRHFQPQFALSRSRPQGARQSVCQTDRG